MPKVLSSLVHLLKMLYTLLFKYLLLFFYFLRTKNEQNFKEIKPQLRRHKKFTKKKTTDQQKKINKDIKKNTK